MDDQRKRPMQSLNINLLLRKLHGYGALLTASTLVFFAVTGLLQVLGLHEARGGSPPSAVVAALGRLHKDQVLARPGGGRTSGRAASPNAHASEHSEREQGAARPDAVHARPAPKLATTLLKAFVIGAACLLVVTTLIGVWIGLQDSRRRTKHLALLGIGFAAPLILVIVLR